MSQSASNELRKSLSRALDGGEADLARVLAAYRPYLLSIARTDLSTTVSPRPCPSDLVQQTIAKARKHFGEFRGQTCEDFARWLSQILREEHSTARVFPGPASEPVPDRPSGRAEKERKPPCDPRGENPWIASADPLHDSGFRPPHLPESGSTPEPSTRDIANTPGPGRTTPNAASASVGRVRETHHVGRFELIRVLGQGGFGVVWLAYDPKLGRPVALKIPRLHAFTDEEGRERFLREAQAAAKLNHPNIVQVLDTGDADGVLYTVTAYCEGSDLARWISETAPAPPDLAAEVVALLADAVQYSHARGILHRDIKPSNVLVSPRAEGSGNGSLPFVPRLTDFGLAKFVDIGGAVTQTQDVLGTPQYMAPERSRNTGESVGPQNDVYSLGVVLYELLTGRLPFLGSTFAEILDEMRTRDVLPPSRLVRGVSHDLDAVCLKCLELSPSGRYASAGELADDLRRYLRREPTRARPIPAWTRAARICRRHPATSSLVSLLAITLLLFLFGLSFHNKQLAESSRIADESRRVADENRRIADENRRIAERNEARAVASQLETQRQGYATGMRLVASYHSEGDYARATDELMRLIPAEGQKDLREFAWYYYHSILRKQDRRTGDGDFVRISTTGPLYDICVCKAANIIAVAGKDSVVDILDATTLEVIKSIPTEQIEVNDVEFNETGKWMATAGDDGTARVYDWRHFSEGDEPLTIHTGHGKAFQAKFHYRDRRLLTCGTDHQIRNWDLSGEGEEIPTEAVHEGNVEYLAVDPSGPRLSFWSASQDGSILYWDTPVRPGDPLRRSDAGVSAIALSPKNRKLVASAGLDGTVIAGVGDSLSTMKVIEQLLDPAHSLTFSPDGSWLLCGDRAGVIHCWEVGADNRKGTPERRRKSWKGHDSRVYGLTFSADGKTLFSAGDDGKLRRWNWPIGTDVAKGPSGVFRCVSLSGQRLALLRSEAKLCLWDHSDPSADPDSTVVVVKEGVVDLAGSDKGNRIAIRVGESIEIWDTEPELKFRSRVVDAEKDRNIRLSPNGDLLCLAARGKPAEFFDVATSRATFQLSDSVSRPTFSWDSRHVAVVQQNDIVIWDVATRRLDRRLKRHTNTVNDIAFDPAGRSVVSAGDDRLILRWDLDSQNPPQSLGGHRAKANSVAFSPDGTTLASADIEGTIILWQARTGQELCLLPKPMLRGRNLDDGLSFSRDGRYVYWLDGDGNLFVYDSGPREQAKSAESSASH